MQVFDFWNRWIRITHHLIACYQALVSLPESLDNILNVENQSLLEEIILLVQLKESEQISLADHLIAVHVKHLESKLLDYV